MMNDYPAIIVNSGPSFQNMGFPRLSPIMRLAAAFNGTVKQRISNNSVFYKQYDNSPYYGGKT